jgi:hypothetical protein
MPCISTLFLKKGEVMDDKPTPKDKAEESTAHDQPTKESKNNDRLQSKKDYEMIPCKRGYPSPKKEKP